MIQKIKNQNISCKAFTLIELVIVLVIIGIILMMTMYLSGEQIQKVKDKTVKESILAEMQSRYSRNLGSSSYGGKIYESMEVSFSGGSNKINFKYRTKSDGDIENFFTDKFEIKYMSGDGERTNNITLIYTPYNTICKIGSGENERNKLDIITRVNDSKDYCFEINQKNCRLVEMSEPKCDNLVNLYSKPS